MQHFTLIRRLTHLAPAVLLVLLSVTTALAFSLTLFRASYDGNTVRVEWEVSTEADVTGFDLYRKSEAAPAFVLVSNVAPNGQRRYTYVDANVYRAAPGNPSPSAGPLSGGPFTYRLTVRGTGPDQNFITVLAGTPSSVQRSWGSIKSMFK